MRRRWALTLGAAVAGWAVLAGAGSAQAALNVNWNWATGFVPNLPNAAVPPPGANNWNCDVRKTPNKIPLILVHGTVEQQSDNFQALSPYFVNNGYCVYTFNYGGNKNDVFWGYKSVAANAGELKAFVNIVLARTGASQVDLVGHSQGGMMPRYYIKYLGGMGKVHKLVGLASSNNGTTGSGLAELASTLGLVPTITETLPAAVDQTIGSAFMRKVNRCPSGTYNVCKGDTTVYTSIETDGDQVVTPYTGAFLTKEPGSTTSVTNILVNDQCPLELSEHLGMTYSQNVASRALNALNPNGAKTTCVLSLPYLGG